MEFRTIIDIPAPTFRIAPFEEMLFVGSCFAEGIGRRFRDALFRATVNPYGVMYNPVSVMHTVDRYLKEHPSAMPRTVFITLGTNHVYRLRETGEIVDNCEKRPAALFHEEQLTVDDCADSLRQTITLLRQRNAEVRVVMTVSPIRYRKYGYHGSQLSKATLLIAADRLCADDNTICYFPAYEIVQDELRDYRFYAPDMLHPSEQAVEYIWQRLTDTMLSDEAKTFLNKWRPIRQALGHRPLHPDSPDHRAFVEQTQQRLSALRQKYPDMPPV